MTPWKRLLDLTGALLVLALLWPVILTVAAVILWRDGRPVLHISERMRAPGRAFRLIKFRTMQPSAGDRGVSGGDKAGRITRTGALLRRYRLDELPQVWNVLRGDMSLVGPRPPLRQYVEAFPDIYGAVLACRPGLTGLASLEFHAREEALLYPCRSPEETEHVYVHRCIPAKARLDMIYCRRRSLALDLTLLGRTFLRLLPRRGP
ncbi:sugar transferase [Pseudooceanicola algae]|uniref:Putative sugar transferase EpsL n=1 Tax=Pseudooceanicola algae TaxID=1537215 RepID=A0A418SBC3_9RHOB|nr:sugar transferase [Pseudooceanicola algae]QPM91353.1 putative sugar transferase EpsL [Pseudooceanicola algae]